MQLLHFRYTQYNKTFLLFAKDFFDYINSIAPFEKQCEWDNSGLLLGDPDKQVKTVAVVLDATKKTVEAAKKAQADMIVTHHPVIFSPLKNVLSGSIAFELIKAGISVISMHTNLDIAENGGVNACLCKALDIKNTKTMIASDGYTLMQGKIAPTNAESFAKQIKKRLGGSVKFTDGGKIIENVLVCSGSGGEFIAEAIKNGFDALVTADIKHHQFLEAADNCISLFDAGHFNTEDIVIEPLRQMLADKFKTTEFITTHETEIKYV